MSKIVCDICGTVYPETAEECPICGCTKEATAALLADVGLEEELVAAPVVEETVVFTPARPVAEPVVEDDDDEDDDDDYEDEEDDDDYDDDDDDDDDDEEEDEQKSNGLLVALLVIVILMLLAVSAFIVVKYVVPNVMGPKETAPATTVATVPSTEATEQVIPCENLALTSGGEIVLDAEGANWLINVLALPENTTDELVYSSSDESVATVNEMGKITAVGEGTAVITITCGEQELKCTVTVNFTPETTVPEATEPETEATTEATEPETTLPDVVISFVKNDVTSRMIGEQFYLKVKPSELDASLLTWSSENENVCVVDQKGLVTIKGRGTTYVVVTYGDQVIKCIVRVH